MFVGFLLCFLVFLFLLSRLRLIGQQGRSLVLLNRFAFLSIPLSMLPVIFFKNIDFMYHHYEWVFAGISYGSSVFLIMIFSSMLSVFIALMFKFGYRDQKSLFASIKIRKVVMGLLVYFALIFMLN